MVYAGITNQSTPIPYGNCRYIGTSALTYTVMSDDTRTEFLCDVGNNVTCGGDYISSLFTLYSVVVNVIANSTPEVTSGVDTVKVTCSVTGLRLFYDWSVNIHRNMSKDSAGEELLISLMHDGITKITRVVWWKPELQARANYSTDLTQTDTATLGILLDSDHVTCLDGGLYRCELSGDTPSGENIQADDTTSVVVVVNPGNIDEVRGEGDDIDVVRGGVFPIESGLVLTCNSSIGNPPLEINWCVMTSADSEWSIYPDTSNITQSDTTSESCDHRRISQLTTVVKDIDLSTLFLCEIGYNLTCVQSLLNATFSLYAVDVGMAFEGTTSVIGGLNDLQIKCFQNESGIGLLENTTIRIYHQSKGSQLQLLVSLTFDNSTGRDVFTWHSPEMANLWVATGSLTQLSTGYLQLTLPGPDVTCREAGMYECALQGHIRQYADITRMDRLEVDVQVLPGRIEPIEGKCGTTVLTGEGRFPVGGAVSLLCNSTVGDPAFNLYWIVKRANDTDYTPYNDTDQSKPSVSESCQLRRTSRLVWTVTSADEETVFVCAVGPTNISSRLNTTFTLFAIPCEGDCTVVTTAVPIPSAGMTSGVITASVVTPLILLAMLITLVIMLKYPGARAVLCKRKSIETKVKPHDTRLIIENTEYFIDHFAEEKEVEREMNRLNIPDDLNNMGSSAPPTGTSMTNGQGATI